MGILLVYDVYHGNRLLLIPESSIPFIQFVHVQTMKRSCPHERKKRQTTIHIIHLLHYKNED